jgi:hypothetical protein
MKLHYQGLGNYTDFDNLSSTEGYYEQNDLWHPLLIGYFGIKTFKEGELLDLENNTQKPLMVATKLIK